MTFRSARSECGTTKSDQLANSREWITHPPYAKATSLTRKFVNWKVSWNSHRGFNELCQCGTQFRLFVSRCDRSGNLAPSNRSSDWFEGGIHHLQRGYQIGVRRYSPGLYG